MLLLTFYIYFYTSLLKVEENLTLKKLSGWLTNMKSKPVAVHFPSFRIEDNFSLKEKLQAMGLKDIFSSEHASLPGKAVLLSTVYSAH